MERSSGDDADGLGEDEELVSQRSGRKYDVVASETSVIDVRNGLNARGEYCHSENMTTIWVTRPHFKPSFVWLTELSKAPIHWKNRTATIPRMID